MDLAPLRVPLRCSRAFACTLLFVAHLLCLRATHASAAHDLEHEQVVRATRAYLAGPGGARIRRRLRLRKEVEFDPFVHFSRAEISGETVNRSARMSDAHLLHHMGVHVPGLHGVASRVNLPYPEVSGLPSRVLGAKSEFDVWYEGGASASARQAFEYATKIWADTYASSVPIRILFKWSTGVESTTLAATSSPFAITSRDRNTHLLRADAAYTPAMASAVQGVDFFDERHPHIVMTFNALQNWHYDTSISAPPSKFDLATVALHEQCHGLFFSGAIDVGRGIRSADFRSEGEKPGRFDQFIQTRTGVGIARSCNRSMRFKAITTPGLRFRTITGQTTFGLFAPEGYKAGSSTYHFDHNTLAEDCRVHGISRQDCSDLMTFELRPAYTRRIIGEPVMQVMRTVMSSNAGLMESTCVIPPSVGGAGTAGQLGSSHQSAAARFSPPTSVIIVAASLGAVGAIVVVYFIVVAFRR